MRLAGDGGRKIPRRQNLTKTVIESLACSPGKRTLVVYDEAVRSLNITVTPSNRSFYVYRKLNGRPVRFRLGGYPELTPEVARKLALKHLAGMAEGIDPRDARRAIRTSMTLGELHTKWLENHAKQRHRPRTIEVEESLWKVCLEDWAGRPLATLREQDVRDKHADIAKERGQTTANRAVQLLRRMFNYARLPINPAGKGAVDFFKEKTRDRFLQPDELPRFFKSLAAEPYETAADAIRILILTGARRSNVQSMRWEEVDLERSTWTIPGSKTKNGDPLPVHLVEEAKVILRARKELATKKAADGDERYGRGFVFPSYRVDAKVPHLTELKTVWARILERAKIDDLRVHDLRRTLGSWQAVLGTSLPIIGKSLGHSHQAATAIYARLHLDPVRASVEAATAAILKAAEAETEAAPEKQGGEKAHKEKRKKTK